MRSNIFIILWGIFALMACGNPEKAGDSDMGDERVNVQAEEAGGAKKSPLDEKALNNFEKLPGVDYRGKIVDKFTWKDEIGHNYILAIEYKSANNVEVDIESSEWMDNPVMPDYSEMCIKSYILNNGRLQQLYNFCDNCTLPLNTIEYIGKSIETTDMDKDGQVEIYYMYKIVPDGIDPAKVFLVISHKSDKTVISGVLPVMEEEADLAFEKKYDSKFKSLPAAIQAYAQKKWDKTMKSELGK
jgi:hypothetical protein